MSGARAHPETGHGRPCQPRSDFYRHKVPAEASALLKESMGVKKLAKATADAAINDTDLRKQANKNVRAAARLVWRVVSSRAGTGDNRQTPGTLNDRREEAA